MVVRLGILLIHKVGIVGTHQFDAIFLSQFDEHLVRLLLQGEGITVGTDRRILHLMALQLQVVVVAPEPLVPLDGLTRPSDVALQDLGRHLTSDTGRAYDQVLVVFLQFMTVCTRTTVETVHPRVAHEFDEVLIAVGILRQYDEVIATLVISGLLQVHVATTRHIHLTAEDRLEGFEAVFLTLFVHAVADVVKFLNAEHVAVIGDGHALHTVADGFIYKLLDTRLSVEDRVVGMYMQMYEIFHS